MSEGETTDSGAVEMRAFLDEFERAEPWLSAVGFANPAQAHRNFVHIAENGVPIDLLAELREEFTRLLPVSADPDRALNNFERMLGQVRSPLSMTTFMLRKPNSLAVLLQLFATSQYFSDLIIANPEYFDFLWESGQVALDPKLLKDEVLGELKQVWNNDEQALNLIRRHRQRELLRIGYRDIILGEPLDRITRSISDLADGLVEVALSVAYHRASVKHGEPRSPDGRLSRLIVLGMGKLGGRELNYSSDIDLILVYDHDGVTDGRKSIQNNEFFSLVIREMVRLLSANTARGQAYRVDLRLRPHGNTASLCMSIDSTLAYYDQHGRTWERQALVKARPIAGSFPLGEEFLRRIEPFVYRRYLSFVEINEIKSIKRRIENKATPASADGADLKTGPGGIRDIEFVVQFLQLVNGGVLGEIRERNSLLALRKLAAAGCINPDERTALEMGYRFLRKAEHRLQFMFDLQTHRIPEGRVELDKLALRLGYLSGEDARPGEEFLRDLRAIGDRNQQILKHLMLELFPGEDGGAARIGEPVTDLILDPDPDFERIKEVLGKYRFADVGQAYQNLILLGREEVPFLSSVRCRHFLANIGPELLGTVVEAPDPDMALNNLEKVSASLGAKGVLWECFSFNPAFLRLYVNLCSWSQFLSEILINSPGMIDELLDALIMNRPPDREESSRELDLLMRGAREISPILHSFKNGRLLRIGVNDILGKTSLPETTRALSDLAEVVLAAVADRHFREMTEAHGTPMTAEGEESGYALLGLGKLGGGELGYHSDLDMILIYDADGRVKPSSPDRPSPHGITTNHHFYTEFAQGIVKTLSAMTAFGRIYQVDLRLRPTGRSGSLVIPLDRFDDYYQGKSGEGAALWERLALTRARVVKGEAKLQSRIYASIQRALNSSEWSSAIIDEAQGMRHRLEESRAANDIKRGPGGLVDIEFACQLLQIKLARTRPDLLSPNIWSFLDRLNAEKVLDQDTLDEFRDGYTFLRSVESRLRIVYNVARDDVPNSPVEREKLAMRLGYDGPDAGKILVEDIHRVTAGVRRRFIAILDRERQEASG